MSAYSNPNGCLQDILLTASDQNYHVDDRPWQRHANERILEDNQTPARYFQTLQRAEMPTYYSHSGLMEHHGESHNMDVAVKVAELPEQRPQHHHSSQ